MSFSNSTQVENGPLSFAWQAIYQGTIVEVTTGWDVIKDLWIAHVNVVETGGLRRIGKALGHVNRAAAVGAGFDLAKKAIDSRGT